MLLALYSKQRAGRCLTHLGTEGFRAYMFFEKDKDIKACKNNGIIRDLIDFVYDALERAGRGRRQDVTVGFEFDSDENVEANYEGDYLLRLR